MEESPESLLNSVPMNLRGVDVLLVHDDNVTLTYLSSLLEQYSFKVTVSDVATEAMSIICNKEEKFKLVMTKANMPGMDIICFLDLLLQKDILLICTYFGGYHDVAKEAPIGGVAFILQEPIHLQDLKYVWQHVYHTNENLEKANPNTKYKDKVDEAKATVRILDDNKDNLIEKIPKLTSNQVNFNINDQQIAHNKGEEIREHNNNESASNEENTTRKKRRTRVWTPELHQRFTEALGELGGRRNPKAKEVLDKMNVPYLTVRQVASYMQRHKQMQCERDSIVPTVTIPSNFKGRTEFPTLLAGVMTLPTCLIESQNQNQFTMDVVNPLYHQETPHNATSRYGLSNFFSNYGSTNIDAIVGNQELATSRSQNQSLLRPYEPPTAFANYRCENVDSSTTSVNQNQWLLQYQQNHGNATFPFEFTRRLENYENQNVDAVAQNLVPNASINYNSQSFQLQGNQDNSNFHYKLPMGLANYEIQNMDVMQNNVPVSSMNQNKYPFQLQTTQGYKTFSNDLPTRLASYGSQNLDFLAQNSVPTTSMILNKSQGNVNFPFEFPTGLADRESQNIEASLQNHVPIWLANYKIQNVDVDVNNTVPPTSTEQNQSYGADPIEWVRNFLLKDG